MRKITILAIVGVMLFSLIVNVQPALACTAGCTPGFWKQPQHFVYWTGFSPGDTIGSVFGEVYYPDDTLFAALSYHGGRGVEGAERIMLRAAVATMLTSAYDAAHDDVHWGYGYWTVERIRDKVNEALARGNRDHMLHFARKFDNYNNLGCLIMD